VLTLTHYEALCKLARIFLFFWPPRVIGVA